jgi:ABC-type sugar transport system substrate-binding protein
VSSRTASWFQKNRLLRIGLRWDAHPPNLTVSPEDIYIISIDAVRDAFVAMLAGDLNCTVSSSPLMGPLGFDALEAVWDGQELDDWIVVPDEKYCRDEVTQEVVDSRP